MPGMYAENDYDVAGTIVGVVDERRMVDGRRIARGDVMIGLPSTGLHTNGYSLARAVLLKEHRLSDRIDALGQTLGEALLAVHRSYLRAVAPLLPSGAVKGMAHVTGGGIAGNAKRILPKGRSLKIDWNSWQRPPIFELIQVSGRVPEEDMRRTFNLGVGLVLVVGPRHADRVLRQLKRRREHPFVMGEIG
jgi:phosphoribosylformylglycinamidine cyclo-ligase